MQAKYKVLGAVALLFVALVALFLFTQNNNKQNPPSAQRTPVTIGYLPIAAGLPLFVAVEHGFFNEAGFDVTLTRFSSSNELGNAGASGRVDAMMPYALNVAFDIGNVSGQHAKLFGVNTYSDKPPHIVDYFVVGPNSGITKLADLRGKTIGAFPGSVTRIFVEYVLRQAGISPEEYTYVELSPPDWQPALLSGRIDAASVMEPQYSQIIADGAAKNLMDGLFAKVMPDVPLSGHWLSARFADNTDKQKLAAFVGAYDRAVDFIRQNPEDAKRAYKNYIPLREDLLPKLQLNKWTKSSEVDPAVIQQFADLLSKNGAIQAPIKAADYVYRPQ
jgi:NitT/TauT family transport system substrate-binding protein